MIRKATAWEENDAEILTLWYDSMIVGHDHDNNDAPDDELLAQHHQSLQQRRPYAIRRNRDLQIGRASCRERV